MAGYPKRVKRTIRKQKTKVIKDATLLRGIKQGVGMIVKRPFGTGSSRPRRAALRGKPTSKRAALCALSPQHLPLPRAVGAYTVTKTTTILNAPPSRLLLFGTIKGGRSNHPDTAWFNSVCVSSVGTGSAISAPNNALFHIDTALGATGFDHARLVPAALTVQVMCPRSLQTAEGIVYIGRTKQVLDLMGDSRTWDTLASELVSYSSPRLCSAGKLALRGVKVDAIPNNMSQLSDFCPRGVISDPAAKTWSDSGINAQFEGFAPIFVYNRDLVSMQYLVTVEWRVRFDPGNPAYGGHSYHPVSSDSVWSDTIRGLEAEGHGVVDMAEGIADFGDAAMAAAGALL